MEILTARKPTTRESAEQEVHGIIEWLNDYAKITKRPAKLLVRELRLAIRQANHGAGPDPGRNNDYNPSLSDGEVLLSICNEFERCFGWRVSTYNSLASVDWDTIV